MRIGFDAIRAFQNATGLGNYSRHVIRILARHFPRDELVLYTPGWDPERAGEWVPMAPGVEVRRPPGWLPGGIARDAWRVFRQGRQALADGVDLYHGLTHEAPRDARRAGLPTVVTMHDLLYRRFPELYRAPDRAIYDWKYRHSCRQADAVIAISEQTRRDVVDFYGIDPEKVEVVYQNCAPRFREAVPPERIEAVRRRHGLPREYLLNVATIEPRKNALVILEAMARLPSQDPFLVIVGRPTSYKSRLVAFAREAGLENRVRFLHDVPDEELPALYQGADLFLYPSIFEGFGIPILEALHSDVPVITSEGSCFPEAGGDAARYISHDDPAALADAIRDVLEDPREAEAMVERGRVHVRRFADDVIAARIREVYERVLET